MLTVPVASKPSSRNCNITTMPEVMQQATVPAICRGTVVLLQAVTSQTTPGDAVVCALI
jgi:hypothetical protein